MSTTHGHRTLEHPLLQRLWRTILSTMKLHGALVAELERLQVWDNDLDEPTVEHLYHRMSQLHEAWEDLVTCDAWQCVDDASADDAD